MQHGRAMSRINSSWYTTGNDDWATPRWLFKQLDREFRFTLDPCATPANATCSTFYTSAQDGRLQPWTGRVFCNPPYGRGTGEWFAKAARELAAGTIELAVFLTPARTDTAWFQRYVLHAHEIRFIRGRLTYGLGQAPSAAPFPSCVSVFRLPPLPQGPLVLSMSNKPGMGL